MTGIRGAPLNARSCRRRRRGGRASSGDRLHRRDRSSSASPRRFSVGLPDAKPHGRLPPPAPGTTAKCWQNLPHPSETRNFTGRRFAPRDGGSTRSNRARMCNPPDWQHGVARNAFWHFRDPTWSTSVEFRARATVIRDTFWVRNPSGKEAGSPLLFPTHRRVPGHVGFFKGIFLEAAHWAARRVRSRPDPSRDRSPKRSNLESVGRNRGDVGRGMPRALRPGGPRAPR